MVRDSSVALMIGGNLSLDRGGLSAFPRRRETSTMRSPGTGDDSVRCINSIRLTSQAHTHVAVRRAGRRVSQPSSACRSSSRSPVARSAARGPNCGEGDSRCHDQRTPLACVRGDVCSRSATGQDIWTAQSERTVPRSHSPQVSHSMVDRKSARRCSSSLRQFRVSLEKLDRRRRQPEHVMSTPGSHHRRQTLERKVREDRTKVGRHVDVDSSMTIA
jgi:hypothetical protein